MTMLAHLTTWCALIECVLLVGVGVCLPLPADVVVMVPAPRLYREAGSSAQGDTDGAGGGGGQGEAICGLQGVDRFLRSQHSPEPVAWGETQNLNNAPIRFSRFHSVSSSFRSYIFLVAN